MKKYTGSWSANNGSTYNDGYESNNKRSLAKLLRSICKGNVFAGNTGNWSIRETADEYNDYPVASGSIRN